MSRNDSALLPRSVREFLTVLFRHKFKVAGIFLLVTALGTAAVLMSANIYRAEAKLLIRLGRENIAVDPSVPGPTVNPNLNRENDINSELTILTSRSLAEGLVDSLGPAAFLNTGGDSAAESGVRQASRALKSVLKGALTQAGLMTPLSQRDKAVKSVLKSFSAQVEKRTNIISASFEGKDPKVAASALEALIKAYMDRHIEVYSAQASPMFFENQADALRTELEKREKALEDFRTRYGIATMERQKEILLQQVSVSQMQMEDAGAQITATQARIDALAKSLAGRKGVREISRTSGRTNNAADTLKEKIADLRMEETDLSARYPAMHPPLVKVRDQIKELEAALAKEPETLTEVTTGIDSNYEQLKLAMENEEATLSAQQARKGALEKDLEQQRAGLAALAGRETELNRLTRDMQLAESDYRQYREHLQRAKILSAMDLDKISNVSIVQPATPLPAPVRPNKPLDILLTLFAAAVLAVLAAFVFDYFDDSLKSEEDVLAKIGAPVLAVVSEEAFRKCT